MSNGPGRIDGSSVNKEAGRNATGHNEHVV